LAPWRLRRRPGGCAHNYAEGSIGGCAPPRLNTGRLVWAHTDDGNVTLNSSEGRTWPENLRNAGTATVTVIADPYEWVSVTGRLVEDTRGRR
jgi:hypothetical protein